MKLYGALASPYVARVALFARIKGIDLAIEQPPGGSIRSPEYLALNPIGKMPALEVDGTCLPESEVICEFLEETAGGRPGLPGGALDRARARLISRLYDVYIAPHAGTLFRNLNPATRDEVAVKTAAGSLTVGCGYLEHFVRAAPFAAGPALSLADATLVPSFALLKRTAYTAYGLDDVTAREGKLATWWRAVTRDPLCTQFLQDYDVAVDAFLQMLAARK